jgi:Protein of unknown function (DUF2442)
VLLHIVAVEYVGDYKVWLRFDDGAEGEVDLALDLTGPVFLPLRNVNTFRQFRLHPVLRTLVWPNGADFAPEFLRDKLRVSA